MPQTWLSGSVHTKFMFSGDATGPIWGSLCSELLLPSPWDALATSELKFQRSRISQGPSFPVCLSRWFQVFLGALTTMPTMPWPHLKLLRLSPA